jgi:microcystin-dependent protein
VNELDIYPVGAVLAIGATIDPGPLWLPCDGQNLSRDACPEIFAAIGHGYGKGATDDEFKLPDYRGRFLKGARSVEAVGEVQDWATRRPRGTSFSGHAPRLPDKQEQCNALQSGDSVQDGGTLWLTCCTGGGDDETRPVNVYVDYYIKVAMSL